MEWQRWCKEPEGLCIVYSRGKKTSYEESKSKLKLKHIFSMAVHCVSSHILFTISHNVFNVTPDILFDGLRAFKQGSPNMNSLVGFGSAAAFAISAVSEFIVANFCLVIQEYWYTFSFMKVSLLNPEWEWNSTFFDEPVSNLPCTQKD